MAGKHGRQAGRRRGERVVVEGEGDGPLRGEEGAVQAVVGRGDAVVHRDSERQGGRAKKGGGENEITEMKEEGRSQCS